MARWTVVLAITLLGVIAEYGGGCTPGLRRRQSNKLRAPRGVSPTPVAGPPTDAPDQSPSVRLAAALDALVASAPADQRTLYRTEFEGYKKLFHRYLTEPSSSIDWNKIEKLPEKSVVDYATLQEPTAEAVKQMLKKLVMVKLNGGLGTSMGCQGPKSVIAVRGDSTFLDLTVHQIVYLNEQYDADVPLVLMNSFSTDADTEKVISKYKGMRVRLERFQQSRYPRVDRDTLLPLATTVDAAPEAWYPPGHGDFYESLHNSGLLQKFIDEGREYVFLSNIDNLGATVDTNVLGFLTSAAQEGRPQPEFLMEVTEKTKADVKGGTLIQYEDKLRLLEIAQVPKDHVEDFKSIKVFKYFNTNNLWIKLDAIKRLMQAGLMNLDVISNPKTLDNRVTVLQLETAVGAAMKYFSNSIGINVPRRRFLPVKKTSDLLLVMSNLYTLDHGSLVMSPLRTFPTTPEISLVTSHFSKVKEFQSHFASTPDILDLDHLTVSGNVYFGKNVILKGNVVVMANGEERLDIPPGAVLENKLVSGSVRTQDL